MKDIGLLWSKKDCSDSYDELMIKIAMSSYADQEGLTLIEENEALKGRPEYQIPKEAKKFIQNVLKKSKRQQQFNSIKRHAYGVVSKVAIVFLIIFMGFTITMTASAEFRHMIYNLLISAEPRYTQIKVDGDASAFVDYELYTWDGAFALTMMPAGYVFISLDDTGGMYYIKYQNDNGKIIEFSQYKRNETTFTREDTESAVISQSVAINDSMGYLVVKEDWTIVYWNIRNTLLSITSTEETETVIEIARSVKMII